MGPRLVGSAYLHVILFSLQYAHGNAPSHLLFLCLQLSHAILCLFLLLPSLPSLLLLLLLLLRLLLLLLLLYPGSIRRVSMVCKNKKKYNYNTGGRRWKDATPLLLFPSFYSLFSLVLCLFGNMEVQTNFGLFLCGYRHFFPLLYLYKSFFHFFTFPFFILSFASLFFFSHFNVNFFFILFSELYGL